MIKALAQTQEQRTEIFMQAIKDAGLEDWWEETKARSNEIYQHQYSGCIRTMTGRRAGKYLSTSHALPGSRRYELMLKSHSTMTDEDYEFLWGREELLISKAIRKIMRANARKKSGRNAAKRC